MTTETYVDDHGRLIERRLKPDTQRELAVARVVDLSPPTVRAFGHNIRIHARLDGVNVSVGDFVLVCRVEQGAVALGKVQVL